MDAVLADATFHNPYQITPVSYTHLAHGEQMLHSVFVFGAGAQDATGREGSGATAIGSDTGVLRSRTMTRNPALRAPYPDMISIEKTPG